MIILVLCVIQDGVPAAACCLSIACSKAKRQPAMVQGAQQMLQFLQFAHSMHSYITRDSCTSKGKLVKASSRSKTRGMFPQSIGNIPSCRRREEQLFGVLNFKHKSMLHCICDCGDSGTLFQAHVLLHSPGLEQWGHRRRDHERERRAATLTTRVN